MNGNNVYSTAKVISKNDEVQDYQLGTFVKDESGETKQVQVSLPVMTSNTNSEVDTILNEIKTLSNQVNEVNQRITNIENNGMSSKEIDAQVIQAIKDLKNYANFFEQATFQMESKILKTSISIAQKIIAIEIGENSSAIAKQTIIHSLEKIKNASKVKIHLNPKDFVVLKEELNLKNFIELVEDSNVTAGGVVIASDLGNFDGNVEAKVNTMLDSLNNVI